MDASITVRLIDETQRGFSEINRNLTGVGSTAKSLNNTMNGLASAASAFVGALGGREIFNFINTIQSLDNRLKVVTSSTAELDDTYKKLFKVAQETRQPLDGTITLFSRLSLAAEQLNLNTTDLAQLVTNFNKALSVAGATTAEAQSAMIQYSQALTSGKVEMQELRPLLDSAPVLMREMAKALGLTAGELRKFVSEGKITSEMLASALLVATERLAVQFGKTTITVGQAVNKLTNSFQVMARDLLNTSGASQAMVKAIGMLESNLFAVTIALGVFAAALAIGATVQLVTFAIGGLTVAVRGLGAALLFVSGTPMGRFVGVLGIAAGALVAYATDSKSAEKETENLSDTTKELTEEQNKSSKQYTDLQKKLRDQVQAIKQTKDAYGDFIKELKQEIELSKLDSKEKEIQQKVYKALAAEAKKYGGDLSKISEKRRKEIDAEVRALATQVEDEKAKTEQRKKLVDDMRRKQEEYDRFIKDSRTKNLQGLELFLAQQKQAEDDYRAGNFRDETQYQEYLAALRETYQNTYSTKAEEFRTSQLSKEDAYRKEVDRLTKEYDAGMIRNQEDFEALREQIRIKYASKYDDMAKKQREDELTAVQKYQKDIIELNEAANAGLIKNQEDYDAIRRKIDKDYREETIREYSNLYGLLNEKLLSFSGLTQKEYGIVKDVIKLTFGVDVEDLIKEFFAASIRYVLGFRTAASGDINGIGGVISNLFGSGGSGIQDIGIFNSQGSGILDGFGSGVGKVFSGIGGFIGDAFKGGLNFVTDFVGKALNALIGLLSGSSDIFSNIGGFISNVFSGGGGQGGSTGGITDTLSTLANFIPGVGPFISAGIQLLGNSSIGKGISNAVSSVAKGVGNVVGSVVKGVSSAVKSVGSFIGKIFSDVRLKENIDFVSTLPNGINLYDFNYKSPYDSVLGKGTKRGVLAQEIQNTYPSAVSMDSSGFMKVDYTKLGIPPNVVKFAKGGMVGSPTMFNIASGFGVAGEAGAEAILPLSRNSNGELGVSAMAGDINVNFTINAVDAEGLDQILIERKQLITNMVRSAVADKGKIGRYI